MNKSNQSTLQKSKTKFPHSTSKVIFINTFFIHQQICYFVQCQSGQVFVGHFDTAFKIIQQGVFKHHINCIAHCHKHHILYGGSAKGSVMVIKLKQQLPGLQSQQQTKQSILQQKLLKIDPINGQPILSMYAYNNQQDQSPQLIALNNQGILRRYKNNKYQCSINLPFQIIKSISNKTIKNKLDIAMILCKKDGKFPYIFSADFISILFNTKNTKQQITKLIQQYQDALNYQPDQQIQTQKITCLTLSNSKSLLTISYQNKVSIYAIIKNGKWFSVIPDFKFQYQVNVLNLDLVNTCLLYITEKGIGTFDIQKRSKVANGLTFAGSQYQIAFWCSLPYQIIYGTSQAAKMKLISCQLKQLKTQ